MIKIKSIYCKPTPDDGERIYVDPLWADGAFTEFVKINNWLKEVAPSYDLWRFHFNPVNWDDYVRLYREELLLPQKQKALKTLLEKSGQGTITLVFGNKDILHNNAVALKTLLEEMAGNRKAA